MSTPIPSLGNKTPEQLKVAELREELRKRGASIKGLKKDLVERLDGVLRQEEADATDQSKKSGQDEISDGNEEEEEEEVVVLPHYPPSSEEQTEGKAVGLQLDPPEMAVFEQVEALPLVEQLKSGTLTVTLTEDADSPSEGKPAKADDGLQDIVTDLRLAPQEDTVATAGPVGDVTLESLPESRVRPFSPDIKPSDGQTEREDSQEGKHFEGGSPALEEPKIELHETTRDETATPEKLLEAEGQTGFGTAVEADVDRQAEAEKIMRTEQLEPFLYRGPTSSTDAVILEASEAQATGNLVEDAEAEGKPAGRRRSRTPSSPRLSVGPAPGTFVEAEGKTVPGEGVEADMGRQAETDRMIQAEQMEPFSYRGPTSSTDAVIIEASEAESLPVEKAVMAEDWRETDEAMDEGGESVVENVGAESVDVKPGETVTVDTVVTETTVTTTTETIIVEPDLSTAEVEPEGSLTNAEIIRIEGIEKEEPKREEIDERMEDDSQEAKPKHSMRMEIDADNLTGVKRKDGAFPDESRQQEPTKRQRRWNSEKGTGVMAEVKPTPQVITADASKEASPPERAPVARSPTAAVSSIPKVSAKFEKPAPSRPALSRTDITGNGEVEKKRLAPPPLGNPTVSLKIDRFVRPFTIKAVRELLEQTGDVKEMWMDQIKTHCYVTYSSVEEATATRNALYHLQWPVAGGKLLIAEFVEPEEVKLRVEGLTDKPAATPVTTPRGPLNNSAQAANSAAIAPPATSGPMIVLPAASSHASTPVERPAMPPKKEPEPPIPTLDDLFKKTRAKPQVYFLPLTDEQVATKLRSKQSARKEPVKA